MRRCRLRKFHGRLNTDKIIQQVASDLLQVPEDRTLPGSHDKHWSASGPLQVSQDGSQSSQIFIKSDFFRDGYPNLSTERSLARHMMYMIGDILRESLKVLR